MGTEKMCCLVMDRDTANELVGAISTAMDFISEAQDYSCDSEEIESHEQRLKMFSALQEKIETQLRQEYFCTIRWSDEDIKQALQDSKCDVTEAHIAAVRNYCMSRDSFQDTQTSDGNETLRDIVSLLHFYNWEPEYNWGRKHSPELDL